MSAKTPRHNFRKLDNRLKLVGRRLRSIREAKNVSVENASRSLRISASRLQAIEKGEKDYSLALLVRICNYYDVSILDVV
jgi:transcriptional regulator with XRE-family HTH domain